VTKVLVLTSEPITAGQLRDTLGPEGDSSRAEVMVVAPALAGSAVKFWMSDADEAIARPTVRARTGSCCSPTRTRAGVTARNLDDREIAERFGRPVDHAAA
jgi:hypothetical protein